MMQFTQLSFSQLELDGKKRVTRRQRFLSEINRIVPWASLVEVLQPYYPKENVRGRPPRGLEKMLRMYIAQQCLGLSDEGIEDAVYESVSVRQFIGIDLLTEDAPDSTTLLRFRRFLEKHALTELIFSTINEFLASNGLLLKKGSVVDATIINAPTSTKNETKSRDPDMHQTKKGKQWYFGMKAHIATDAQSGLVHSLEATPANVADVTQTHKLLHGQEQDVFADAGYQGVEKREETMNLKLNWYVAMRKGKRKKLGDSIEDQEIESFEKLKSKVRAFVEHPFRWIKQVFGLQKTRYKGLEKNKAQLYTLFSLSNLMTARKHL